MSMLVDTVRSRKNKTNIGGPLWLLQLWLHAILERRLSDKALVDLLVDTYGSYLCYVSAEYLSRDETANFKFYFKIFHSPSSTSSKINFTPFVDRKYGPEWFTKLRTTISKSNESIWAIFLYQRVIFVDGPGFKTHRIYLHLPNTTACQLDFCQSIPAPYSSNPDDHFINAKVPTFDDVMTVGDEDKARKTFLQLVPFSIFHGATQSFLDWWNDFYSNCHLSLKVCLSRIEGTAGNGDDSSMQEQDPTSKTQGELRK